MLNNVYFVALRVFDVYDVCLGSIIICFPSILLDTKINQLLKPRPSTSGLSDLNFFKKEEEEEEEETVLIVFELFFSFYFTLV